MTEDRRSVTVEDLAAALCANRPPEPSPDYAMFVHDECRTLARYIFAALPATEPDAGGLDAAWAETEAALPLAGWMSSDGRWVLPSGSWIIGIEYRPESGDGYSEPHYPPAYFARAQVRTSGSYNGGRGDKWITGEDADTPAAALRALRAALSTEREEPNTPTSVTDSHKSY
jgi:hypothetical protein